VFRLVSVLNVNCLRSHGECLEDFFFAHLTQSLSTEPNGWANDFFHPFFGSFALNCFSTYGLWQESSFYACCEVTVCYVTSFIGPSAPNIVSSLDCSIFPAFEQITFWGTIFHFTQYRHYPSDVSYKISDGFAF